MIVELVLITFINSINVMFIALENLIDMSDEIKNDASNLPASKLGNEHLTLYFYHSVYF